MIAIYFVGSSGSGKTTLATHVEKKYGVAKLPSAARHVLKDWDLRDDQFEELMADKDRYDKFQLAVEGTQASFEAGCQNGFVSDRAFDHLVFRALYGTNAHREFTGQAFKSYMQALAQRRRVIFLVRPTREAFEAAVAGGERLAYLNWEAVHRFDGAMQLMLEIHGLNYIPITTPVLRDRVSLVDAVLGQMMGPVSMPGRGKVEIPPGGIDHMELKRLEADKRQNELLSKIAKFAQEKTE